MKKQLSVLLIALMIVSSTASVAEACSYHRRRIQRTAYLRQSACACNYYPSYTRARYSSSRRYPTYARYPVYRTSPGYYSYEHRSFWQRHRDKLTTAIGAGAGAGLGALIGGKRGAAIGALAGGGGAAVYTYGIRRRHPAYRRY